MMGQPAQRENTLFFIGVNLDDRMPAQHPLREAAAAIDFRFVRERVKDRYGVNGNESLDPAVTLKLMFLLFRENVRSARELMRQLPVRLDWLWFCEMDLDSEIPDHSVLSKARRRWGLETFESIFTHVLEQCAAAGTVLGIGRVWAKSGPLDGVPMVRRWGILHLAPPIYGSRRSGLHELELQRPTQAFSHRTGSSPVRSTSHRCTIGHTSGAIDRLL